ncbi:amino acid ABC transporter permease [Ponticoccus litoralis]|uniref:Glutamate/aspartate import permease protein GltK n=1 Tax=Ponticoccus litoralis TaxID=422297 RepID=A0AAW9SMJ1_9RHOB
MTNLNFRPLWRYEDAWWEGVITTLELTALAVLGGLALGLLGARALRSGHPVATRITRGYVEVIRNTPALIQIFLIFFVLPGLGLRLPPFPAAAIALSIYFGAYMTEIFRSGLDSIPKSQIEAGACLGLSRWQLFRHVVLPPALRNIYPSMTSQFVLLMLGTSLASQVSVDELFHAAGFIDSRTYRSFEVYALACAIYLGMAIFFRLAFAGIGKLAFRWPEGR